MVRMVYKYMKYSENIVWTFTHIVTETVTTPAEAGMRVFIHIKTPLTAAIFTCQSEPRI